MNKPFNFFLKFFLIICIITSIFLITGCDLSTCNHDESEWIYDTNPTIEQKGHMHTECTLCGKILKSKKLPKLEYSLSQVKQQLSKSLVKVYCYDYDGKTLLSQGSGFFLDKSGTFITNAHVVENAYYIKIKTYSGTTHDVNVMYVYNYTGSDHAICKARSCYSTPVEFEEDVSLGETVYALGYPNDVSTLSSAQGTVVSTNVIDKNKTYIENTAKIDHGSSGGILANSKGKVVGITTGILDNDNYAALSYSEIKSDVTKKHYGTKEPLEWFHSKKEVSLSTINFNTYFDVTVTPTPLYGGNIKYNVTISLKPMYRNDKIVIKYTDLSFSVQIDTDYEFYSTLTYGGGWKTSSSLCYAYIDMYNINDLHSKSATTTSSFFYTNYKNLHYDYDYRISYAIGTMIIYS